MLLDWAVGGDGAITYLLNIDAMAGATEDQTCLHGLGKATSLYQRVRDTENGLHVQQALLESKFLLGLLSGN